MEKSTDWDQRRMRRATSSDHYNPRKHRRLPGLASDPSPPLARTPLYHLRRPRRPRYHRYSRCPGVFRCRLRLGAVSSCWDVEEQDLLR
jgi:hypothetical protein